MNVRIVIEVDGQRVSEIVEDVATLDAMELEERVEQLKQRAGRAVLEPGLSAVGEPVAGRVVAAGRCGTRGGVR
jgi:tetrahydromethanopterin S-methyltransferase subunit B